MGSSDSTLYAQWNANTLTISYDVQGGSAVTDGDTTTTTGAAISALPASPTRIGYTFEGWYSASTGGTQITTNNTHGQTGDFTLYARWSAVSTTTSPATTVPTPTTSVLASTTAPTNSTTLPPTSAPAPAEGTSQAVDADGNPLESSATGIVDSGNVIIQIRNSDGTALDIERPQGRVETSYSFERSSPITITGQNYPPEVEINVWLNSARTLLGTSTTDRNGAFEVTGVVPADFELGQHTIEIVATAASGNHTSLLGIQVVDSASSLPSTGSNGELSTVLILLVATGLIISLIRRRVED